MEMDLGQMVLTWSGQMPGERRRVSGPIARDRYRLSKELSMVSSGRLVQTLRRDALPHKTNPLEVFMAFHTASCVVHGGKCAQLLVV